MVSTMLFGHDYAPAANATAKATAKQAQAHQRNRADFIQEVISNPGVIRAGDAANAVCHQPAETGYEIQMKRINCTNAISHLQQQVFQVTVAIFRTTESPGVNAPMPGHERESAIVMELMNEANGFNGGSWWLEGGE